MMFISGASHNSLLKSQDIQTDFSGNEESQNIQIFQDSLGGDGEWVPISQDQLDPENINSDEQVIDNGNTNTDEIVNTDENVNTDDNGYVSQDVYTDYIWVPNQSEGWNPYNDGRWVWTSWGWEWAPNTHWWVTYHYGRWWYSSEYGWVWSPGHEWASNWVDWCYYDGYNDGYYNGYYSGYENGYENGYSQGYHTGYETYKKEMSSMTPYEE